MDYQEAIEILSESFITDKPILETYYTDRDENAINTAISAIQELQDIKSDIDDNVEFLISELRQAKFDIETFWEEPTTLSKAIRNAISALVENQKYKQLGTLEEVRVVVEKQKPKKVIIKPWSPARCPTCGEELSENCGDGYYRHSTFLERCTNVECAQRLIWKE